ncbi:unnamed protein product [Echinostoma caproni]|uniref:Reverse transcriptase domain-containing protein n=1 Tax=Echinostoma caproni TaxID=27848 RepID=A0A183B9N0_9TREM|nr:unnamed protein product [Echinostoma caproni]
MENYRPVSLTGVLCNALEQIIGTHLCEHRTQHRLLSAAQHAFLKGKSCLSNLLHLLDEVKARLDEGKEVEESIGPVEGLGSTPTMDNLAPAMVVGQGCIRRLEYMRPHSPPG